MSMSAAPGRPEQARAPLGGSADHDVTSVGARTLRDIALARSGDKGNRATLSVVALDPKDYPELERLLTADIADPNSEVNLLNESGITTIYNAWGTGLRTWGNRSAAWPTLSHPRNFECVQRTADVIAESIEYFALQMIDAPITNAWIDAVTESVNAFLRTRMAEGAIIDGRCWYEKGHNEATELAAGHVTFDYDFMPPTPAERITFRQTVNIEYLKSLGNKTWAREEA